MDRRLVSFLEPPGSLLKSSSLFDLDVLDGRLGFLAADFGELDSSRFCFSAQSRFSSSSFSSFTQRSSQMLSSSSPEEEDEDDEV